LINCVAGLEMELLGQCRSKCEGMKDVVKFVVPTITKTRSHGANRMVRDTKVKYQGYVFAKLRLTRQTYTAIQQLDLCRSWMGTINMKGYRKLPPAPLPLSEEEIENFDLENVEWEEDSAKEEEDPGIIVDSLENDMEESRIADEIEQEVQEVYKGLRVEDMVKVTAKNKFLDEDGIVRRLKEGKVLIRFFTYGTTFDEWLDPSVVRKLTEVEILEGLGGPSAPITQRDLDHPQRGRSGSDFDRRNQIGTFGSRGTRDRRQDLNERRFRGDREQSYDHARERENWNWYKENERRHEGGGYTDGDLEIRGSRDRRDSRRNDSWAERDVDSQWGRNASPRRQARDNSRRQHGDDWSSFVSRTKAPKDRNPPSKEETDDFFESLMSDLSNDLDGGAGAKRVANNYVDSRNSPDEDDFFASLISEISAHEEQPPHDSGKVRSSKRNDNSYNGNDEDDFFASLEREIRGSTGGKAKPKGRSGAEEHLEDIFSELTVDMDKSPKTSLLDGDGEEDFFANLEMELAADLGETDGRKTKASLLRLTNQQVDTSSESDFEDDFFLRLETELKSDWSEGTSADEIPSRSRQEQSRDADAAKDDDFFSTLETELDSDIYEQSSFEPASQEGVDDDLDGDSLFSSLETDELADFEKSLEETGASPRSEEGKASKSKQKETPAKGAENLTVEIHSAFDVSDLQKRTVPQLKDMLRERGLKVSGKKSELIERLSTGS